MPNLAIPTSDFQYLDPNTDPSLQQKKEEILSLMGEGFKGSVSLIKVPDTDLIFYEFCIGGEDKMYTSFVVEPHLLDVPKLVESLKDCLEMYQTEYQFGALYAYADLCLEWLAKDHHFTGCQFDHELWHAEYKNKVIGIRLGPPSEMEGNHDNS